MPFDNLPPDMKRLLAKELSTKDVSALQRVNKSTKTALDPVMKRRMDEMAKSIETQLSSMRDSEAHDAWARIRACLAYEEISSDKQSDYDVDVGVLGMTLLTWHKFQKHRFEHRFWVGLYGMYKMVRARAKMVFPNWDWQGPGPESI